MQIGIVGLGRMGGNMARRLMRQKHEIVVYDRSAKAVQALAREGFKSANTLKDLVEKLDPPRAVWLMVPAGPPTEETVDGLHPHLEGGDVIIDGGNSYYKDDVRRSQSFREKGVFYVDAGTSGGVWGIDRGYCLMIGGELEAVKRLEPIFATLAPGQGNIPSSRKEHTFAEKMLSAMRNKFGGHVESYPGN